MLDGDRGARHVEGMLAAGLPVLGGSAIGKLTAVVVQDLGDLELPSGLEFAQEMAVTRLRRAAIEIQEDPLCGPVDGNEQVATRGLVRRLRRVLHVEVD
jgi:hypothetical protein